MNTERDTAILIFYVVINLLAFAFYGIDKQKAQKNLWRIPEKTLLLSAFFGGPLGALCGMEYFHHKTKKKYFWVLNILALAIHVILMYFLFFRS